MAKIYNNEPYYEYYDKKKGYIKMLAVPLKEELNL